MQNKKHIQYDKSVEIPQLSFKTFLFNTSRNKIILLLAFIAIIIQFSIFKYLYPYASYIHGDSFVYLDTAYRNLDINTYMIGYSKFLRLFSVFTDSDIILTLFQYVLVQCSSLFLLFTLFYFYNPSKIVQTILLLFTILNPLLLYLANLISSDCYFLSLSLIWFSLLLWIIHKPNMGLIILHSVVLFIAFTVRYNALIYPLIAVVAFVLSKLSIQKKTIGIATGFLLTGVFIFYTGNKFKNLTGTWQYSPFSGWQMANNAMYAYRYVDSSKRKPVPERFKALDKMIREYFDSTRDIRKHPQEAFIASTVYMWDPRISPLYKYRNKLFKKDSTASELKKWSSMGPLYKDYGIHIIKQYPSHFLRYFIWPNANKYYAPPVEYLGAYNMGKDSVAPIAQVWFGYKSQKVTTRTKTVKVNLLDFYPILSGVINVVMLFSLVFFSMLKGWKNSMVFRKGVLLSSVVWLLNALFTISASSAALRFQAFPILLTTTFGLLLVDWIWKMASVKIEINSVKTDSVINNLQISN